MPLNMDIHEQVKGLAAEAVVGAHARDLETHEKYGVRLVQENRHTC